MAVTTEFFPRARFDRAAPGGVPQFPTGGTGGVELISFHVQTTGITRSSRSTQLLTGPALLDEFRVMFSSGSNPPNMVVDLGLSLNAVLEDDVPVGTPKPYTTLFTHVERADTAIDPTLRGGFSDQSGASVWVNDVFRLQLPIWNPQFRLVIAVIIPVIVSLHVSGHLVVRTGLDPELLRNFL